MTSDQWQQLIYRALGIPDAVKDKAAIAKELLANVEWPSEGDDTERPPSEAGLRVEARNVVLSQLAEHLEKGEIDRLLVPRNDGSATEDGVQRLASRLAESMQSATENSEDDVAARETVLLVVLPKIVRWVMDHPNE
jgi:hypothetical protein